METKLRKYVPDDYLRVRDFLVANYKAFEHPVNWALVRWNYARYLCAPMLGACGLGTEAKRPPDTSDKSSREAIRFWENSIGIWENERGEIAGVVCPDEYVPWHPAFGQAFLQRHPDYEHLLPEMLAYAEQTFAGKVTTRIFVGEPDKSLQEAAKKRGFVRDEKPCINYMLFDLENIPEPDLPDGYRFVSREENNNLKNSGK